MELRLTLKCVIRVVLMACAALHVCAKLSTGSTDSFAIVSGLNKHNKRAIRTTISENDQCRLPRLFVCEVNLNWNTSLEKVIGNAHMSDYFETFAIAEDSIEIEVSGRYKTNNGTYPHKKDEKPNNSSSQIDETRDILSLYINKSFNIVSDIQNTIERVTEVCLFVPSYSVSFIESYCNITNGEISVLAENIDLVIRKPVCSMCDMFNTLLGYLFFRVVTCIHYVALCIGSIFNSQICFYIRCTLRYSLEDPLTLLGEFLQSFVFFIVEAFLYIVLNIPLYILKFLLHTTFRLIACVLQLPFFLIEFAVLTLVFCMKLLTTYPLTLVIHVVFENKYIFISFMTILTLLLYIGLVMFAFTLVCASLRFIVWLGVHIMFRTVCMYLQRCIMVCMQPFMRFVGVIPDSYIRISKTSTHGECCICYEYGVFVRLVPCNHSEICLSCVRKIQRNDGICPLCRSYIRSWQNTQK